MQNIAIEDYQTQTPIQGPAESAVFPVPQVREADPLGTYHDATFGARWMYLKADAPIKVTEELLASFRDKRSALQTEITRDLAAGRQPRVRYLIFTSERPGVFSLGGDLSYFKEKIADKDRDALRKYAKACIDLVYDTVTGMRLPLTTIALVQGTAQGGGFEFALAHNVVIAERQSQMGLPEIMFNMFPGMGAYQLLCRRVPPAKAENLILSGRTFSAEELHEMGIVDIVVDEGKGEEAVWEYIREADARKNGRDALRRAIQQVDALRYEDLAKIVDVWVDAAFNLNDTDLKMMDYLVRAQRRMWS